eukprot:gnl/Chilomastix_cuspidata/890.p1 GENE.gnl/Chilomastix_cuspidata/890~~gnl/Chilomastix_cuspidata/890.p1  ORF type:complete len:372 (+),score=165.64 gnl/Chilomastix_cuspidata/890:774-1889(+)
MSNDFLVIGNPLLDLTASEGGEFVGKIGYLIGHAYLLDEKQNADFEEKLFERFPSITFEPSPGGSGLNTARILKQLSDEESLDQRVLFAGRVARDKNGVDLMKLCDGCGLRGFFQIEEPDAEHLTGFCRSFVLRKERALLTHLGAASRLSPEIFEATGLAAELDRLRFCYVSSFVCSDSFSVVRELARAAPAAGFQIVSNIASPFIASTFTREVTFLIRASVMTFGNKAEYTAYLNALARAAAAPAPPPWVSELDFAAPLASVDMDDVVQIERFMHGTFGTSFVVTDGKHPLAATAAGGVETFPPIFIERSRIVDSNGAGDAFVAGFFSRLLRERAPTLPLAHALLVECVAAANAASLRIIVNVGCKMAPK